MEADQYFKFQVDVIERNSKRDLVDYQSKIVQLAKDIKILFDAGNKIAFCGNGGSASEASHLAAEFLGKCVTPHDPLPALSLNDSSAVLTAIANDYGYHEIFSRQVAGQLKSGDLLIALSTSGTSANIRRALETGNSLGVRTILWTGAECGEVQGVDVWRSQHKLTPRIQESHLMWGHILVEIFENAQV